MLTDNNATADSISLGTGGLTLSGGTLCGTAPSLNSAPLTFSSGFTAGPNCISGTQDQIQARTGNDVLTGTIPTGYTLVANATVSTTTAVTNDGELQLAGGTLIVGSATTFTNSGSFDTTSANGTLDASSTTGGAFTTTSSGSWTVEGNLTIGSNGSEPALTNDGTLTLSSTGDLSFDGASSLTNGGVLTDNNAVADNISLGTGGLTVTGGTLCGTAPSLNSAPLTFVGTPTPGPDCAAGVAQDEIQARSGINVLTGTIPTGYTLVVNATVSTNSAVTNDGSIVLAGGTLIISSTNTFTNDGGFDTTSANGTLDATTSTGGTFVNGSDGNWTIEGNLTVASNGSSPALTNSGFLGIAPGAELSLDGGVTLTNTASGTVAFGISGVNTSTSNYGIISGKTNLQGGTLDPVDDNGFIPVSGTEYFVMLGTNTGTFTTVLHNATADYSQSNKTGVVGGAPATPTTTTVTSTVNPAVYGQPLSVTATVTPSSGSNPTGSVTFYAGSTAIGTQAVSTSAGTTTASIEISSLRVGTDSVTAVYSGDAVFNSSTSGTLAQAIDPDPSNVSIAPSPPSPVPGQQETYTVEVSATAPGAGTPTGDVSLTDNGTPITGCQNLVMGPLGPSFVTCSVTYQATGSHSIGASYAGDTDFTSGTGSQPVTVQPAATATALTTSANPGPLGAPVTYTATVSILSPGTGTPTGSVSFTDNGSAVSDCQSLNLPATGPFQVTCTETYGTNASHLVVATYSGDTNDATSHNSLNETLQQIGTTTSVGAPSTSTYGQAVTLTATITPSQSASVDPSGTVTFDDFGTTPIGSAGVSTTDGVTTATLTTSSLGAGDHSITAVYGGDQTFTTSTSSTPALLSIAEAATTLTVGSSANPSVIGQSVVFTATLSSSATGETGTIQFADNGTSIGSGTVSGGQATLQTSSLALGSHAITAVYEGDDNFVGASSTNTISQVVNQAATTTGVVSSANPGTVGTSITYTATVTVNGPGAGQPTGTVSFSDGGSPIAICQNLTLPGTSPPSATCAQVYSTNSPHDITATYDGDPNFLGSTGSVTETLSTVSTTTSVGAAPSTATYGQSVVITATVAPTSGVADPTGSVTFTDNGTTTLGSSTLSTTAGVTTASILVTTLPVGSDSISASYGGGTGFGPSSSLTSAPVSVAMSPTTLGLGSATNPSTFGQSVTFTATVFTTTGSGETGTVTFFDNGGSIGTGSVSNGQATLTTSALAVATHPITASYSGDANFIGSTTTSEVSQVVNQAPTSLSLQSSLNPSTSGQSVTFTATVTPTTGSGETGTVTFFDNGGSIGTGSVSNGQASLITSALAAGTHPITASYGGDSDFVGSSTAGALNEVVNSGQVATTIALTSSVNPSTVGQNVTLTASVAPVGGGTPSFTGSVTFSEGATVLGTSPVTGSGLSSISLPQLSSTSAIGTHLFTASFSGGGNYLGSSTTSPYSQVVAPPIFITSSDGNNFGIANSATDAYTTVLSSSGTGGCFCAASNFLAVTPDGSRAYVMHPSQTNTTIYAVNTATGSIVATIPLPYRAEDLTMSPNGANLYVAESVPGEVVAVINTATNTVTRNISIGLGPNGTAEAMAINPAGTELAITQDTVVTMVNLTTNSVTANIPLNGSEGVTFSPNGATAYVTNGFQGGGGFGANTVSAINTATNTIGRTYSGMTEPIAVAVTPDGAQLFVANVGTYNAGGGHYVTTPYVAAINTSSGTETNYMQSTIPENVSVSPDGKSVYIADSASGQVGIWNASTHVQVGTIAVAGQPDTVKPFGDTAPPPPPPPPPVRITTTSLPGAAQSVYYSTPLAATNGQSPYSWSLSSGALPAGLGLTPSGFITGTPSATATASTFTVKVADSQYPPSTATATFTLGVAPASTAPPPCGGSAAAGYTPVRTPPNCVTATNTTPGGAASATSTSSTGTITVTAHGTGGFTIGQTGTAPPDVPFRAASDAFDLDLSSSNTFTSITVTDCALAGATSLQWWNAAANFGAGAWQAVTPASYNPLSRCLTITFSSTSSPTIAQLDGTTFGGVLAAETVTITKGGSAPYSITGSVLSGAVSITQGPLVTQVAGTVLLSGASGELVTVTINTACVLGVCGGTFSVSDPQAGTSFTTPVTATLGQVSANAASGQGVVLPGPGLKNSYPLSWSVAMATS
ncbi:MAG: Ig-like domain repeat protein [Acidimicrobiales bacterium]